MIPLKPIGDDLIVQRVDAVTKVGAIHLPGEQETNEATIVALGHGRLNPATGTYTLGFNVAVGDKVRLRNYGGTPFTHDGKKYMLLKQEDLLALIPPVIT